MISSRRSTCSASTHSQGFHYHDFRHHTHQFIYRLASRGVRGKKLAARQSHAYDVVLVQRFNRGDEAAFVEIVSRHREKVFGVVNALLRNHADAEEITQDTFIRAHRGLANFRGDSALVTWLHRIAVNLSRNRYWYFFRRRRHLTLALDTPLSTDGNATFADIIASDAESAGDELETSEISELVAQCMERLHPRHREILTLRNLLHKSYEEIAAALSIDIGTVKSRIARARESLRVLLHEESRGEVGFGTHRDT